ncbi:hypothetical protein C8F01DRAFT_1264272 [Mycena amicta]|nr:hypothetical protein C8F01DRAFT_1264272 [Mycena amicta]
MSPLLRYDRLQLRAGPPPANADCAIDREGLIAISPDRDDYIGNPSTTAENMRQKWKLRDQRSSAWLRDASHFSRLESRGEARRSGILTVRPVQSSENLAQAGSAALEVPGLGPRRRVLSALSQTVSGSQSPVMLWSHYNLSTNDKTISPRPLDDPTHILIMYDQTVPADKNKGDFPHIEMAICDLVLLVNAPRILASSFPRREQYTLPRVLLYMPDLATAHAVVTFLHTLHQQELFRACIPQWILDAMMPLPLPIALKDPELSDTASFATTQAKRSLGSLRWFHKKSAASSMVSLLATTAAGPDIEYDQRRNDALKMQTERAKDLIRASMTSNDIGPTSDELGRARDRLRGIKKTLCYLGFTWNTGTCNEPVWEELIARLGVVERAIELRAQLVEDAREKMMGPRRWQY